MHHFSTNITSKKPYPFGMEMKTYSADSNGYRYGFNGKEIDRDEEGMGGGGSTYDYGFRIYNPQIAKFLSIDPLTYNYPWYTPFQFAGNMPIAAIDLDGLEEWSVIRWTKDGKFIGITIIHQTKEEAIKSAIIAATKEEVDNIAAYKEKLMQVEGDLAGEFITKKEAKSLRVKFNDKINKAEIKKAILAKEAEKSAVARYNKFFQASYEVVGDLGVPELLSGEVDKLGSTGSFTDFLRDQPLVESLNATNKLVVEVGGPAEAKLSKSEWMASYPANIAQNVLFNLTYPTNFATNSYTLTDEDKKALNEMVSILTLIQDMNIIIEGHTDTKGAAEDNIELSKKRAEAAKSYLVSQGISADRITTLGKGETDLEVETEDEVDNAQNRRLKVIVND